DILPRISAKVSRMIAENSKVSPPTLPDSFRFEKTADRSLLGTINDMFRMAKYDPHDSFQSDIWLRETEDLLNETPFTRMQMQSPGPIFKTRIQFEGERPGNFA